MGDDGIVRKIVTPNRTAGGRPPRNVGTSHKDKRVKVRDQEDPSYDTAQDSIFEISRNIQVNKF